MLRSSFHSARFIAAGWACVLFAAARADERPAFDPPPRLATTRAEWQAHQASADFARQREAALLAGEALLAQPIEVPAGPGNWIFYYACPADGSTLRPISAGEHQCPKCDKTYSDERTVEAYRTRLHNEVDAAALKLAWAYRYSGDERFAREVRRLLVRLADDYPGYPRRRDRWGRSGIFATIGGRRYIQSLDEAVAVIQLAKSYDLTRTSAVWTDTNRTHVEAELFRNIADTLLWWNSGRNNHQTWYNAGLVAIGSVLADENLVAKALDGRGGFHDQLARSVGDDGLWYEGAMAYHNYALQALIETVEAGRRLGLKLHEEPRFRSLFTGPLDYVYPNGQFPAINDSDPSSIASFDAHFAWAWRTYRDPLFAQAYARGDAKRLLQLTGDANLTAEPLAPTSKNLAGVGLAVLRRGTGADAVCAMLDYGQHGEGHGHYDKLNLLLFAGGREWLLDPGRLTYSHPEYKTWVKETAAHNTVVLGNRSQLATTGELPLFDARDDYVACVGLSRGAYPGSTLTRYLVLTDELLIDRFVVATSKATQIDWHAHAQCRELAPLGDVAAGKPARLGDHDGYPHLTGGVERTLDGPSHWVFRDDQSRSLGLSIPDRGTQTIITSIGIGYATSQAAPCLTRRVQGQFASFWTVYELFPDRKILLQAAQAEGSDDELLVDTTAARWRIVCRNNSVQCCREPRPQ